MASTASPSPWMEAGKESGLVLSAQRGDRDAFLELVRHYQRPIYRIAFALTRDPDDASELTKQVLAHTWKDLKHLPAGRALYPWLTRLARSLSVVVRRRRAGVPKTPPAHAAGAGISRERIEREQRVLDAFAALAPDDQLALALRVVEKLSYEDIAASLEVPARTAMSRLASAREQLRTGAARPGGPS